MVAHVMVTAAVRGAANSLGGVLEVIAQRLDHRHAEAVSKLRVRSLEVIIDNVTTAQINALQDQCRQVLELFAEQARHYMNEMSDISKESQNKATSHRERLDLHSRKIEIDDKLSAIRADAQLVYARMGILLTEVGNAGISFARNLSIPLVLSQSSIASY